MARPKLLAFDFFGTLANNDIAVWVETIADIAREQQLDIDGRTLHAEWSSREQNFRKTRTNMADPDASPPFRTYWEAWRDAFAETFAAHNLPGDPDAAADRCVDDHGRRPAFPDATPALEQLRTMMPLTVMSNADDRFLDGSISFNNWTFNTVVSSERARAYKPDPRAFHALLKLTEVAPEEVVYVGDSPYDDAHGAKLVGMRTVLIRRDQHTPGRTPPPESTKLLPPDHVINELTELPALLDSLA